MYWNPQKYFDVQTKKNTMHLFEGSWVKKYIFRSSNQLYKNLQKHIKPTFLPSCLKVSETFLKSREYIIKFSTSLPYPRVRGVGGILLKSTSAKSCSFFCMCSRTGQQRKVEKGWNGVREIGSTRHYYMARGRFVCGCGVVEGPDGVQGGHRSCSSIRDGERIG